MGKYTDKKLLEMFQNTETKNMAFNHIINQNQERAYWHIRKIVLSHEDANDITQNTFIKVWKNLDKFKGESKLYTWIYRIATNEALTHLRKKKRRFFLPIGDLENELISTLEADTYYSGDEIQLNLQKAILTLPEKQRLVFTLRYYDEMPYGEMSQVLETSEGALKASYHHAVKKVEDFLLNH